MSHKQQILYSIGSITVRCCPYAKMQTHVIYVVLSFGRWTVTYLQYLKSVHNRLKVKFRRPGPNSTHVCLMKAVCDYEIASLVAVC